jgi:protein phosphatase
MGGHENGEVASKSVCDSFGDFLSSIKEDDFNRKVFERALKHAYSELNDKDSSDDRAKKMGTTLTFLYLYSKGACMAHIGDSRIYHLRRKDNSAVILYKSKDHSLVNELVHAGIITPEEAATHPKRNVITNVMQPNQKKPGTPTIFETDDVKADDFFFLCSDGALECLSDDRLLSIIAGNDDVKNKMNAIYDVCNGKTRDNFSAYLVRVSETVDEKQTEETAPVFSDAETTMTDAMTTDETIRTDIPKPESDSRENPSAKKSKAIFWILLLIAAAMLFLFGKPLLLKIKSDDGRIKTDMADCYSTHRNKGIEAYEAGKYAEAKKHFSAALKCTSGTNADNDINDRIKQCDEAINRKKKERIEHEPNQQDSAPKSRKSPVPKIQDSVRSQDALPQ